MVGMRRGTSQEDYISALQYNDLQEFSDGFSIARDKGFFLGGPDGWSGFIICTLDAWLKDETSCEEANEDILSVVEVDGKPVVFLLHESD